MYAISNYGKMINDHVRMDAYLSALRTSVTPDCVVVDIGTGPGIFALLACHFGARKVYAIEKSNSIALARQLAAANGFADRIEFIQGNSISVNLPERADIVISDLRGILPLAGKNIPIVIDARKRFLKRQGTLIPSADKLWVVLAEAPEALQPQQEPWMGNDVDLDLRAGARFVANEVGRRRIQWEQTLCEPICWASLDYSTIECASVTGRLEVEPLRSGTAHGLSMWFEACFLGSKGFSTAPWEAETVYSTAFLPLLEPVELEPGDRVVVDLGAHLVDDDYVWTWTTKVQSMSPFRLKAHFVQSSFLSMPLSLSQIKMRAPDYAPTISDDGQIDCRALELMNGQRTLQEIRDALASQFPNSENDLMERLRELSQKYDVEAHGS